MRLLPATLRGRVSLMLTGGMVAVLVAGSTVALWSLSTSRGAPPSMDFPGRVAALAASSEALPPEERARLPRAARAIGVEMRPTGPNEPIRVRGDDYTDRIGERLAAELAPLGVKVLAIGHAPVAGEGFWAHRHDIIARIELSDGAQLTFIQRGEWSVPMLLGQLAPILLVLGAGLTGLALWVAARLTRPLGEFAMAATRLGTNVDAPPLTERGPTELRTAARAFNATQRRIKRLLEDRAAMLAAIAHDLRTPLMRLHLRAELIGDEDQRRRMEQDLAEMDEMITAALTFAREDVEAEPQTDLDLRALLADVRDALSELGRSVVLEAPVGVPFTGRRAGLRRAFSNLIDNAAKYGNGAVVRLQTRPESVVVTIEDEGPGIPKEQLEDVFRPFYRVEGSRNRDTGGTGLGLPLARAIVRAHGGEVTLENRAAGGLRQTVVLPHPAASASRLDEAGRSSSRPRVDPGGRLRPGV